MSLDRDVREALEHINNYFAEDRFTLDDFTLSFLGLIPTEDILLTYDSGDWLDIEAGELSMSQDQELKEALDSFRGEQWADMALRWVSDGRIPPIIISSFPDEDGYIHTEIADGRGRFNLAHGLLWPIEVYYLEYKA